MSITQPHLITGPHRRLLNAAAIVTFLLVVMGGVVCVTDSSQGCPDWPWCYGRLIPPPQMNSIIEYTHRALAAVTTLLILISAWLGWKKKGNARWVKWLPLLAIFFLIAVSIFGAIVVLGHLPRGLAAADLGSALLTLALMLTTAMVGAILSRDAKTQLRFTLRSPLAKQTFWTTLTVFITLVSAVLVAESGSIERCVGWPLFSMDLISAGVFGGLQIARRVFAAIAVLMILTLIVGVLRRKELERPVRSMAVWLAVFLALELVFGWLMIATGFALFTRLVYVLMAVAIWSLLVMLMVRSALEPHKG